MSKLVEAFLSDAIRHEATQSLVQQILERLFEMFSPILLGVALLWGLLLVVCIITLILVATKGGVGV